MFVWEAYVGAGIVLLAVYLYRRRGGSGGCTAHHWDDGLEKPSYRVELSGFEYYTLRQKRVYQCKHDGCTATRVDWVEKRTVHEDELRLFWEGE